MEVLCRIIRVDEQVSDGDMIGRLKVIHTSGHTSRHISLLCRRKTPFGSTLDL